MRQTSANGQIFICSKCSKIHLEFNGIAIDFQGVDRLKDFYRYLHSIDGSFYEFENQHSQYRRKIMIPFQSTCIRMLVSSGELNELYQLTSRFIASTKYASNSLIQGKELRKLCRVEMCQGVN